MATTPRIDRGGMRASDGDRALVQELLHTAYVDGRLTKDELEERTALTMAAKTFNDLAPITADLVPSGPRATTQYSSPTTAKELVIEPGSPEREAINVVLGETKRSAGWRLRASTDLNVFLGEAELDLREVVFESTTPSIKVNACLGEVRIIVPDGVAVRDQTSVVLGEVKLLGLPQNGGTATLSITGHVVLGEIKVIGPRQSKAKNKWW